MQSSFLLSSFSPFFSRYALLYSRLHCRLVGNFAILPFLFINTDHSTFNSKNKFENFINVSSPIFNKEIFKKNFFNHFNNEFCV